MDRDRTGRRNPNYRHGAAGYGRETPEYKVWRFRRRCGAKRVSDAATRTRHTPRRDRP